jgi:hypothetical protein
MVGILYPSKWMVRRWFLEMATAGVFSWADISANQNVAAMGCEGAP